MGGMGKVGPQNFGRGRKVGVGQKQYSSHSIPFIILTMSLYVIVPDIYPLNSLCSFQIQIHMTLKLYSLCYKKNYNKFFVW